MVGTKKKKVHSRRAPFPGGHGLLRNVVENAVVPTFLADASNGIVYANKAFADLLGYEPAEVIGLGIDDFVHPDDRVQTRAQADGTIATRDGSYRAERRYLRKNGEPVWVLASAAALADEKTGAAQYLTVQLVDIDGQKRAEAELKETARRWNVALEAAGQGVWDHDFRRGTVFYSNT